MVEVVQERLTTRTASDEDWRFIAACVAAQIVGAGTEGEGRRLARLWEMLHPDGVV